LSASALVNSRTTVPAALRPWTRNSATSRGFQLGLDIPEWPLGVLTRQDYNIIMDWAFP
jgi:hypothetical protein